MIKSSIFIEKLEVIARHGVFEQERVVGNHFTVSLEVEADLTTAIEDDSYENTICYGTLCKIIQQEMSAPSSTLEHVAGRIIRSVRQTYPQSGTITIELYKKLPPMKAELQGAGVRMIDTP